MKTLILTAVIITNFNSHAMGGSLFKSLTKPFTHTATKIKTLTAPSKTKLIEQYLLEKNLKLSKLDEAVVYAQVSGNSKQVLTDISDKIGELELIGYDLRNDILSVGKVGRASFAESELLAAKLEEFNFLASHISVVLAKNFDRLEARRVLDVYSDIIENVGDFKVKGSMGLINNFKYFQLVLQKSTLDINRSTK